MSSQSSLSQQVSATGASPIPDLHVRRNRTNRVPQNTFWMGTVPATNEHFPLNSLPAGIVWIRGQRETGDGGFDHYQLVVAFKGAKRRTSCTSLFGPGVHWEPTRSQAANDYVWKEDTRVPGSQFEFGQRPVRVNASTDWAQVWDLAKSGDFDSIPDRIRVVSYSNLCRIRADYASPIAMERNIHVFWGATGTGKSRRAWDEAGIDAYAKCPRSKFWEGYSTQTNVVIDEFRGGIDVAHLLRWCDRYPVRVEIKGSSRPLNARSIWITSNLEPSQWYRQDGKFLDEETWKALERRLTITEFQ